MELHHRFTVAAPIEATWAAFNDLERVAPCFPGAELTSVEGDAFTGACKVKLGPISLLYTGKGTFLERDASTYRAVIEAKGKDKRGNGTAGATVTAQLSADGDSTSVEVDTDLQITGKPAQFGRGVMQDVSDKLLEQFVGCLQEKLAPAAVEPAPVEAAAPVAPAAVADAPDLDLLAAIGPALLKRLAPPLLGLLLLLMVIRRLRRG
jgi:carbon monoxide dehydrogenase subunit G